MRVQVDSPWCWLQVISAFILHAVFFGLLFSFGIFYVELLEEFPGQESEAAWIVGINNGVVMLMSPVSFHLLSRLPARVVCCTGTLLTSLALYIASKATSMLVLYVSFGFMFGAGGNLCYMSAIWVLRKNFHRYRDLAFGVSSAGSGAGGIIYGIMLPIIVESRGWRGALEIISCIMLGSFLAAMMMVTAQEESAKVELQEKKALLPRKQSSKGIQMPVPSPWRNRAFLVLSIAILLCAFVSSVPYCHIVNYAIHQSVSKSEGERFPLFMSVGSLLGRVVVGKVSGFRGVSRITLCQITFLIQCLATTLCTLATNTAGLATFSHVFGFFDGAFNLLIAIVVDDVFVDKNQALRALGQLFLLLAMPFMFGAPLAGWLYSQTGSYHVVFLFCGGILFIATALISLVRYLLQTAHKPPVLSLPEEIIVRPIDENSRYQVPVQYHDISRIVSSRACSFLDLAVDVYEGNHLKSSPYLAVYQAQSLGVRDLEANTARKRNAGAQDVLRAEDNAARFRVESEETYTDITGQISGIIKMEDVFSSNQNECPSHSDDVRVKDCCNTLHVSDTCSLDYGDPPSSPELPLKHGSSGISIDDAGYYSAPAPFVDMQSDTQSDVSLGFQDGSMDSFIESDFIGNEKQIDYEEYIVYKDFEHAGGLEKIRSRVYE